MDENRFASQGKLGAIKFWQHFNWDPIFREEMRSAWKTQRVNHDQKRKAAKQGAAALWRRYHSDPTFKDILDQKLKASRSRGGTKSILNLEEEAFKQMLTKSALTQHRPTYLDSGGNALRSLFELRVASALQRGSIPYSVEPRFVVAGHAFYPDFLVAQEQKIIEVVGYAADWYWDKTAEKIKLIVQHHNQIHVAVVTRFLTMMERRLQRVPRVAFFTPYQLDQLTQWCRGNAGVHKAL